MPVAVAACTTLRAALTGPVTAAAVLGSGPYAAYLRVPGPPGVLGLVAYGGTALPVSCLLPRDAAVPQVAQDTRAYVGDGEVRAGGCAWRVARWWEPATVRPAQPVPVPDGAAVRLLAALRRDRALPLPVAVDAALGEAADALGAGDDQTAVRALRDVLGVGDGLTPAGDDAVAGLLLGARAFLPAGLRPVVYAVGDALVRAAPAATTALSAALLDLAARGHAARPAVGTVADLAHPTPAAARTFGALLDLGHSSGSDLAAGLLAAARAVRPTLASEKLPAMTGAFSDGAVRGGGG